MSTEAFAAVSNSPNTKINIEFIQCVTLVHFQSIVFILFTSSSSFSSSCLKNSAVVFPFTGFD